MLSNCAARVFILALIGFICLVAIVVALAIAVLFAGYIGVEVASAAECTMFQGQCYYPMPFPNPGSVTYLPLVLQ